MKVQFAASNYPFDKIFPSLLAEPEAEFVKLMCVVVGGNSGSSGCLKPQY